MQRSLTSRESRLLRFVGWTALVVGNLGFWSSVLQDDGAPGVWLIWIIWGLIGVTALRDKRQRYEIDQLKEENLRLRDSLSGPVPEVGEPAHPQ